MLDKLYYLESTKGLIKSALEEKGVEIPTNTPFRQYPSFIRNLGAGELEEHIQGKLSIIRALNNKFGLDIQREATYPEIVEAINLILVKNLQRTFTVKNNTNTWNTWSLQTNISYGKNHRVPTLRSFNIANTLNLDNFTLNTNM